MVVRIGLQTERESSTAYLAVNHLANALPGLAIELHKLQLLNWCELLRAGSDALSSDLSARLTERCLQEPVNEEQEVPLREMFKQPSRS